MIKTVFMGTPEFALEPLQVLIDNTDIVLVVTQPDKLVGRKRVLTPSPVKKKALENNIPVFQPAKIKCDYESIKEAKPDLIVTCAYGQILPKELLAIPRLGAINIHASLLPKYRGGAPIQYALLNGEEKTGVTIMYMDEAMDTGDMIVQEEIAILDSDNIDTLREKLSLLGANMLKKTLPSLANETNPRIKQDNSLATYAPIIKREQEHIDFNKPAKEVFNQVRALYPAAYFLLNGEEVKVLDGYIGLPSKSPELVITKDAIGIPCADKIYYITELKPFGKKAMKTRDYLNGIDKIKLKDCKVG